jgi:hypothetical protein
VRLRLYLMTDKCIRIATVDVNEILHEGLRYALEAAPAFLVAAEASNGD